MAEPMTDASQRPRATTHIIDSRALYDALDVVRESRGLSWRAVGRETGICSSTFSRLGGGCSIEGNAFVSLISWLRLDANRFITRREADGA